MLLMVGAVLVGLLLFSDMLPKGEGEGGGLQVISPGVVNLGRPRPSVENPKGVPTDYITERPWGQMLSGPVFGHNEGDPVFIKDVLDGWRPASERRDKPAVVQLLLPRKSCDFTSPEHGAKLVHLAAHSPEPKAGIYSYTREQVLLKIDAWVENLRKGTDFVPFVPSGTAMRVFDIVVTDREPLHLILHNQSENILFNFHLAPGANIRGISIFGGDANAVAGLAKDVPIEVIDRARLIACDLAPINRGGMFYQAYNTEETRRMSPADRHELIIGKLRQLGKFRRWFEGEFGRDFETPHVVYRYADGALLGPLPASPEARVTYSSLAGAYVTAQVEDVIRVVGRDRWPGAFKLEVRQVGWALAGGDPAQIAVPQKMWRN